MPASTDINRDTGEPIYDFDAVVQSIDVIMTTMLGERVMREWFGNPGIALLGQPGNAHHILRFWSSILTAITALQLNGLPTEPRFRVTQIRQISLDRAGHYEVGLDGEYMPRGHLGDFTIEGQRTIRVARERDGNLQVSATPV